ncbi:unnamed protein product, partial [Ectocarpus fasciculatus]
MGWLKADPNNSCCREAGHTVPAMGWLKADPNDKCRREAGHDALFTGAFESYTSHVSLRGQTTDPMLAADEGSISCPHSDLDRSSKTELCFKNPIGIANVNPKGLIAGTRLEMQTSELLWLG